MLLKYFPTFHTVGRGGSLVNSVPFVWSVAGSNSTLDTTQGPWASSSLAVAWNSLGLDSVGKDNINLNNFDTELRLFKMYIILLPILLHGAETWTLTRALETQLDVLQRWCLKRILRVPFSAYVTNADIYQRAVRSRFPRWYNAGDSSYSATSRAVMQTTRELWRLRSMVPREIWRGQ